MLHQSLIEADECIIDQICGIMTAHGKYPKSKRFPLNCRQQAKTLYSNQFEYNCINISKHSNVVCVSKSYQCNCLMLSTPKST